MALVANLTLQTTFGHPTSDHGFHIGDLGLRFAHIVQE
ncbi:hypothetical protein SynRS9909_02071 [Synechococcus sp. RS9909]|nr:hypothetical protein SynRS9909_02071 [Synechococcus sp. RS9909]